MKLRFHVMLALLVALAVTFTPTRDAEAKPQLLRAWAQVHGTVASGGTNYFQAHATPYVGYGGQAGVQIIVFELYFDANVFRLGRQTGATSATMWNQLAGGLYFPVNLMADGRLKLFGRANLAFVFAPYDGSGATDLEEFVGTDLNRGIATLAGGGIDYYPSRFLAVGASVTGGYHLFGVRSNNDNGAHVFGQLYTRFEFGVGR